MNETELEVINLLYDKKVKFAIIGGHAVRFHGYDRNTQDLDILFMPHPSNAALLHPILQKLVPKPPQKSELERSWKKIAFEYKGVDFDFLSSIDGIETDEALTNIVIDTEGTVKIPFINKENLIKSKQASAEKAKEHFDKETNDIKHLR